MAQAALFRAPPVASQEAGWMRTLTEALTWYRWEHMHVIPLRTKYGWRTGTTTIGWPDIVALRGQWIVAIEAKGRRTAKGPGQVAWLERFAAIPTGRAWMLRPQDDWDTICDWLQHPEEAPDRYGW